MIALIWLHVGSMVMGFAMLAADTAAFMAIARTRNSLLIGILLRKAGLLATAGRALVVLGFITGLVLAKPFGYGAPWVVGSYVLVATSMVLGAAVIDPLRGRILEAARNGNEQRLRILCTARWPSAAGLLIAVIWQVVIGLMVFKPGCAYFFCQK